MAYAQPDLEARNQIAELRNELAALRRDMAKLMPLLNLQVDPASGGGQIIVSGPTAVLRINSLTASSAKLP